MLKSVCKMGSDLRIIDVGEGMFQFKFTMESQLKWVMNNGPWNFDNYPLVLRRWERGVKVASVKFQTLPIWIWIWGLPFDLLTEETGREIKKGIWNVVETDTTTFTSEQARFIDIRIEVLLDKTIRRGWVVSSLKGDKIHIGFKYERLVGFFYHCGLFRHKAKDYLKPRDLSQAKLPYGEWLKAGHRRKDESNVRNGAEHNISMHNGAFNANTYHGENSWQTDPQAMITESLRSYLCGPIISDLIKCQTDKAIKQGVNGVEGETVPNLPKDLISMLLEYISSTKNTPTLSKTTHEISHDRGKNH